MKKRGINNEALTAMVDMMPKLKRTIILTFAPETFSSEDSGTILYFMDEVADPVMAFRKEVDVVYILFHDGTDWRTIKTLIPCKSDFEVHISGKGLGDIFINEEKFTEMVDVRDIALVYGRVVDFMVKNIKYPDPEPEVSCLAKRYSH
jgi:hypothetical protein